MFEHRYFEKQGFDRALIVLLLLFVQLEWNFDCLKTFSSVVLNVQQRIKEVLLYDSVLVLISG